MATSGSKPRAAAKPKPDRPRQAALAVSDQQLGGEMALLGELSVVERGVGRFKIGAAVLLVSVEEERIEPPVEVVVALDIVFRPAARIGRFFLSHHRNGKSSRKAKNNAQTFIAAASIVSDAIL